MQQGAASYSTVAVQKNKERMVSLSRSSTDAIVYRSNGLEALKLVGYGRRIVDEELYRISCRNSDRTVIGIRKAGSLGISKEMDRRAVKTGGIRCEDDLQVEVVCETYRERESCPWAKARWEALHRQLNKDIWRRMFTRDGHPPPFVYPCKREKELL